MNSQLHASVALSPVFIEKYSYPNCLSFDEFVKYLFISLETPIASRFGRITPGIHRKVQLSKLFFLWRILKIFVHIRRNPYMNSQIHASVYTPCTHRKGQLPNIFFLDEFLKYFFHIPRYSYMNSQLHASVVLPPVFIEKYSYPNYFSFDEFLKYLFISLETPIWIASFTLRSYYPRYSSQRAVTQNFILGGILKIAFLIPRNSCIRKLSRHIIKYDPQYEVTRAQQRDSC